MQLENHLLDCFFLKTEYSVVSMSSLFIVETMYYLTLFLCFVITHLLTLISPFSHTHSL
jgi:hypothetical protein